MATPQDYIISFDFTAFTNQFSQLQRSYTNFGDMLRQVSDVVSQDLSKLSEKTTALHSDLARLGLALNSGYGLFSSNMQKTVSYLDDLDKKTAGIAENMSKMSGVGLHSLVGAGNGLPQDKDTVAERLSDIGGGATALGADDPAVVAQEALRKAEEALSGKPTTGAGKKEDELSILEKEGKGARAAAGNAASQLTGGLLNGGGGIIGMAIGFMLLGYQDKTRKAAEMGEMVNVFEAGMTTLGDATTQAAIKDLSAFQEIAQKKYGIGRKEVQAIAKDFIDIGITSKAMMKNISTSLGEVGEDVVKLTLGIDKMFNMASGTSSKHVTELMTSYGDTLTEASNKYLRLAGAAQTSGMGFQRFVDSVYAGGQALSQYGIDLKDVQNVLRTIQQQYKDMGLGDQKAGDLAANAVQGISSAVASASTGLLSQLGQRVYPQEASKGASALELAQMVRDGVSRMKSGKDRGFYQKLGKGIKEDIQAISSNVSEQIEAGMRRWGLDQQQTKSVLGVDWDNIKDFSQMPKGLKDAFGVEGQTMSALEKMQYDMMQGVAKIGQGLLKVVVGILGAVVTGFRALIVAVQLANPLTRNRDEKIAEIDRLMELQTTSLKAGLSDVINGTGELAGAFGDLFKDLGGPLAAALTSYDKEPAPRSNEELAARYKGATPEEKRAIEQEGFEKVREETFNDVKTIISDVIDFWTGNNEGKITTEEVPETYRGGNSRVASAPKIPPQPAVKIIGVIPAQAIRKSVDITDKNRVEGY